MQNPEKAKEMINFCEGKGEKKKSVCKERALSIYVALNLSKSKYRRLKACSVEYGNELYPSYYQIGLAKSDCYPLKSAIEISETRAEIELQALLDHTTKRILKSISAENETFTEES